jgi:hypothetical protein
MCVKRFLFLLRVLLLQGHLLLRLIVLAQVSVRA